VLPACPLPPATNCKAEKKQRSVSASRKSYTLTEQDPRLEIEEMDPKSIDRSAGRETVPP